MAHVISAETLHGCFEAGMTYESTSRDDQCDRNLAPGMQSQLPHPRERNQEDEEIQEEVGQLKRHVQVVLISARAFHPPIPRLGERCAESQCRNKRSHRICDADSKARIAGVAGHFVNAKDAFDKQNSCDPDD